MKFELGRGVCHKSLFIFRQVYIKLESFFPVPMVEVSKKGGKIWSCDFLSLTVKSLSADSIFAAWCCVCEELFFLDILVWKFGGAV